MTFCNLGSPPVDGVELMIEPTKTALPDSDTPEQMLLDDSPGQVESAPPAPLYDGSKHGKRSYASLYNRYTACRGQGRDSFIGLPEPAHDPGRNYLAVLTAITNECNHACKLVSRMQHPWVFMQGLPRSWRRVVLWEL
jgi:hypothetical protein